MNQLKKVLPGYFTDGTFFVNCNISELHETNHLCSDKVKSAYFDTLETIRRALDIDIKYPGLRGLAFVL